MIKSIEVHSSPLLTQPDVVETSYRRTLPRGRRRVSLVPHRRVIQYPHIPQPENRFGLDYIPASEDVCRLPTTLAYSPFQRWDLPGGGKQP